MKKMKFVLGKIPREGYIHGEVQIRKGKMLPEVCFQDGEKEMEILETHILLSIQVMAMLMEDWVD